MAYGERIRQYRELCEMTQDQLGKKADIPSTSISRIEKGVRKVTLEEAARLSEVLGVDLGTLAGVSAEEGEKKSTQEAGELMTAVRELLHRCPKQQRRAMAQVFYALGKQMDVAQAV